ncbi:MAG: HAMP domain-containing protein [bacterium]|nr:HAMP domain-containing protein [bacterium]
MLKNLSIGHKIIGGFSLILILTAVAVLFSVFGIGGIKGNATGVIQGHELSAHFTQVKLDHLHWLNELDQFLKDDDITELTVQTDDHKCRLGTWLYSEDRESAEELIPEMAPLLQSLEEPHYLLHASAIEIDDYYSYADPKLPATLVARHVDQMEWADILKNAFLTNAASIDVTLDPVKCEMGQWLTSAEGQEIYAKGNTEFRAAWDDLMREHALLHESGEMIHETYAQIHPGLKGELLDYLTDSMNWAQNVSASVIKGDKKLDVNLDPTQSALGRFFATSRYTGFESSYAEMFSALESTRMSLGYMYEAAGKIDAALQAGKTEIAKTAFRDELLSEMNSVQYWLGEGIAAEDRLIEKRNAAKGIYDVTTTPALQACLASLGHLQEIAEANLRGYYHAEEIYATRTLDARDEIMGLVDGMSDILHENMPSDAAMMSKVSSTRIGVMTTGLIALVLGIGLALLISRSIVGPIRQGADFAQVVADGDFTQSLDMDSKDEVGGMANALNAMSGNLRTALLSIGEQAETVSSASEMLFSTANEMGAGAEDVSSRSGMISSAVEEMSDNLTTVASSSEEMSSTVSTIAAAVEEMSASLSEVARSSGQASQVATTAVGKTRTTSEVMERLSNSATEIDKVLDTISDIADQTNLLALNATIEAASAGDAGKGFAVVANEVKELAKQTAVATEEISHQIDEMQTNTKNAVGAIGEISGIISEIDDISTTIASAVEEQSATISEIAQSISGASQATTEISSNVQSASTNASEMADSAKSVSQTAQSTVQSVSLTSSAAGELAEMALTLKDVVKRFKVTS